MIGTKKKRVAFEKAPQNFWLEKILKDAKIRIPGKKFFLLTFSCKYVTYFPGNEMANMKTDRLKERKNCLINIIIIRR